MSIRRLAWVIRAVPVERLDVQIFPAVAHRVRRQAQEDLFFALGLCCSCLLSASGEQRRSCEYQGKKHNQAHTHNRYSALFPVHDSSSFKQVLCLSSA
jgi:hypothetical protein